MTVALQYYPVVLYRAIPFHITGDGGPLTGGGLMTRP